MTNPEQPTKGNEAVEFANKILANSEWHLVSRQTASGVYSVNIRGYKKEVDRSRELVMTEYVIELASQQIAHTISASEKIKTLNLVVMKSFEYEVNDNTLSTYTNSFIPDANGDIDEKKSKSIGKSKEQQHALGLSKANSEDWKSFLTLIKELATQS